MQIRIQHIIYISAYEIVYLQMNRPELDSRMKNYWKFLCNKA